MSKKKKHKKKNVASKKEVGSAAKSQKLTATTVSRVSDKVTKSVKTTKGSTQKKDQTAKRKNKEATKQKEEKKDLDATDVYLAASEKKEEKKDSKSMSENKAHVHHHKHTHHVCQSGKLRKKVKSLTSALIMISGFAAGSIFVDVAQFFTDRGLSARALGEARVVEYDGSTWVKYDEDKVYVDVFLSRENSKEVRTKVDDVLSALAFFMPTLEARIIDIDSDKGRQKAKEAGISYAPAMHFSASLSENAYYTNAADVFRPRDDGSYVLRMDQVTIPVTYYIDTPDDDAGLIVGTPSAPRSVIVYENAVCDTCLAIQEVLTKFQGQNPEKIKVTYKNIPAGDDENAKAAAYAAHCAYASGNYNRYMRTLFTNSAWKSVDADARENLFVQYASYIPQMNTEEFRSCYTTREYDGQLIADVNEAEKFGITSVPTVFVDGQPLQVTQEQGVDEVLNQKLQEVSEEAAPTQ